MKNCLDILTKKNYRIISKDRDFLTMSNIIFLNTGTKLEFHSYKLTSKLLPNFFVKVRLNKKLKKTNGHSFCRSI